MVNAATWKSPRWALVLGVTAALLCSCEGVLGIEDAELDPLHEQQQADRCDVYCDTVSASCADDDAVYTNRDTCLAFCATLPPGQPSDEVGNSVACRLHQAELALATGEPQVHCPLAGPGGNGTCGGNCEAYCVAFQQVCSARFDERFVGVADCVQACERDVPDLGDYDVTMQSGDSVQCRLWHLSAAAVDANFHCPHAAGEAPCQDP